MALIFAFLFGLIFGSFANVILLRLNTGESIIYSGSRCFSCSRKLAWYEMIPLFSFFALRGRCQSCKSKISIQYPLVELGTGVLFVLIFWSLGFENLLKIGNWELEINWLFVIGAWFFLWIAALYDLRHMILPDRLLILAFIFGIGAFIAHCTGAGACSLHGLLFQFGTGVLAFLFFFIIWFISKGRWMGFGDAKFAFAITPLFAPAHLLIGIALSFFIGSVIGVFLLLLGRVGWKAKIPFGPFLFLGAFVSFVWGERILGWYVGLFL